MELQTLAVDHFALHQRWFALEVGDQRYALDLGSVRTVFYQPLSEPSGEENRAPNLSSVFLNVRSVIVHEGAPVFCSPRARSLAVTNCRSILRCTTSPMSRQPSFHGL